MQDVINDRQKQVNGKVYAKVCPLMLSKIIPFRRGGCVHAIPVKASAQQAR